MTEIEVPIFLHPHLFWIFEKKNNITRHEIGCDLAKEYERYNCNQKEFTIGEVVAVNRNTTWSRALIEDIIDDGNIKYEVWLMDYGFLFVTNSVYKLDKRFKLLSPLVKQASLYNVVFIDKAFCLEESCIIPSKQSVPNAGATVNALQFIRDYTLFFIKKKEVNGIVFGDIVYKKNLKKSFLTKTLIERNLMVEDDELFLKVEQSRIFDKDFHIKALRQCSKTHRQDGYKLDLSVLFDEIFTRSSARGISLSGYSESENESENTKTPRRRDLMKKLHKKLEAQRKHNESCTEGETELNQEILEEECKMEHFKVEQAPKAKLKSLLHKKKKTLEQDNAISDTDLRQSPVPDGSLNCIQSSSSYSTPEQPKDEHINYTKLKGLLLRKRRTLEQDYAISDTDLRQSPVPDGSLNCIQSSCSQSTPEPPKDEHINNTKLKGLLLRKKRTLEQDNAISDTDLRQSPVPDESLNCIQSSSSHSTPEPPKVEHIKNTKLKNLLQKKKQPFQEDSATSEKDLNQSLVSDNSATNSVQSSKTPSKLLLLKQKCAQIQSNMDYSFHSDVESVTSSEYLSSTGRNSLGLSSNTVSEHQKAPKLLKSPNTIFLPGGLRSSSQKSVENTKTKSKSYLSDSSLTVECKKPKIYNKSVEDTLSSDITDAEPKSLSKSNIPGQVCSKNSDSDWNETPKNHEKEQDSKMLMKPYCNCPDCNHWTTSEDWSQRENFKMECKFKELETVRPPSLMLKAQREGIVKLSSINYRAMTKLNKLATYKLLIHAIFLPCPVEHVSEAPFHSVVHRSLKNLGYTRAQKMQTYIWPALVRGYNVCYVHRKKTGKTLAYLAPMCSFLLEKEMRYNDLKKGGPIVLILASSSAQCEEIYDLAGRLLDSSGVKRPKVLLVSYPLKHINMSSVDMLITIPSVFVELLKNNATNLKRLCHFVMEDADILLDKYRNEIKATVDVVESMLSHRITTRSVQMVMSAEHWSLKVENFVKKLEEIPLVCIGDYFEAAIYGGVTLKMKFLESKAKRDAVVDILTNKWNYLKSIVLCNTEEEIKLLKTSLELASITCIAITSNLPKEEILQQEANWEFATGEDNKVLICTDQMLHTMLSITSAVLIVHYSLPQNWTSFIKRFNCILDNCKSPLINDNKKLSCQTYILTDEQCQNQIPKLMSLLKTYNVHLKEYEELTNSILQHREQNKVAGNVQICVNLKQFGYCHVEKCPDRHIFDSDLDTNFLLPKNGCVKFKILELVDVNHLKVNIVEHRDLEGKVTELRSKNNLNDQKLTSLLCMEKTKASVVAKGESYAVWDTEEFDDVFRECVVEEVSSFTANILVKESGRRMMVCKSKIFELPEEIKRNSEEELSSAEMIIANLKPPYKDTKFSARAYLKLAKTIEDLKYDDNLFVGNICLQLGNTIWVDDVTEEVDVFEKNITRTDVTKKIISEKLADRNTGHMSELYRLCKDAEIDLPKYTRVLTKKAAIIDAPQVAPQWAFLEVENCNEVIFSSAFSPEDFYVRLEKFLPLLTSLEKDIDEIVKRQGSKRNFTVTPGSYYLALDSEENKFYRVLVKHVENGEALCFGVDYGDENVVKLEDIRYLPNHLITKLPFQAIHCKLHGLKAIDGEWPAESTDVLYEKYFLENDSDVFRTLYAKCMYYEKGTFRGQSKFSILLKDAYNGNKVILNQLLVDCGWADVNANASIDDFEIPLKNQIIDDDDSSLELEDDGVDEAKDILKTTEMVESNDVGYGDHMDYQNDSELICYFGKSDEEEEQFMSFMNEVLKTTNERSEVSSAINNALPAIEAAPFEVDYNTPDVYWSQTKDYVQLVIKLPNVETYKVKIEKSRMFIFKTIVNEKKYELNIMLYEIVEKEFTHSLGGLEITVKLNKKEHSDWPKLSRSKRRLRNVHYMLTKDDMEEEKPKLLMDIGDEFNIDWSSDESIPVFHVTSDLDSEYDYDIPEDTSS